MLSVISSRKYHKPLLKSKIFKFIAIIMVVFGFNSISTANNANEIAESDSDSGVLVTPNGFKDLVVFIGTGLIDPSVVEPRPGVIGCAGLFCDGEFFQKNISHRTDAEIAVIRSQARAYFISQFGIDVDSPAMAGRFDFSKFMVNPDFQYRVYAMSGENVPAEGWLIRDGGFRLTVTDPQGIALGGKNSGNIAKLGSMLFFGNFNILATNPDGIPEKEMLIYFKSISASDFVADGGFYIKAALFNDQWGDGLGLTSVYLLPQADGRLRANARNVITFPAVSTQMTFPAKPAYDDGVVVNKRRSNQHD